MTYFNIKELYGIPLSMQVSMEQVDAMVSNIAKMYNTEMYTCKPQREHHKEYGYVYVFEAVPTYTVEEILANMQNKQGATRRYSLEQIMWGLYYYICRHFNRGYVEKKMNSDKYKEVTRMIVEKIIADDAGASLISFYHMYHKEVKQ